MSGCSASPRDASPNDTTENVVAQVVQRDEAAETPAPVARGKLLFDDETFLGNGRTCATCHVGNDTAINPAQIQTTFRLRPSDPLFRSLDSNDGHGTDYRLLLRDATFRIPFVLPDNVTVDERDDNVFVDANGRTVVVLRRGVPSVRNILFENELMYDGREGSDLAHQAISAVQTHAQPRRLPMQDEADAMAAFQRTLFTRPSLARYARGAPPPELPEGNTDAQRRGRRFFEQSKRGLCAMCHSGPLLDTTNAFNPIEAKDQRFATDLSSERNVNGYPVYTFHFAMPDGSVRTIKVSDPGRPIITGNPCGDDPAACFINPQSGASVFKIPSLWGIKNTAPYFHDGSAKDLPGLMVQYRDFFHVTAVGIHDPSFEISAGDATDIIAFLELL